MFFWGETLGSLFSDTETSSATLNCQTMIPGRWDISFWGVSQKSISIISRFGDSVFLEASWFKKNKAYRRCVDLWITIFGLQIFFAWVHGVWRGTSPADSGRSCFCISVSSTGNLGRSEKSYNCSSLYSVVCYSFLSLLYMNLELKNGRQDNTRT